MDYACETPINLNDDDTMSYCLLCSDKFPTTAATNRKLSNPGSNISDLDHRIKEWGRLFKLAQADVKALSLDSNPGLRESLTNPLSCCLSCTDLFHQIHTKWTQLNELYSQIDQLREEMERKLQETVGSGIVAQQAWHYKLLKALRMSQHHEVDLEALAFLKGWSLPRTNKEHGLSDPDASSYNILLQDVKVEEAVEAAVENDTITEFDNLPSLHIHGCDQGESESKSKGYDGDHDWVPSPLDFDPDSYGEDELPLSSVPASARRVKVHSRGRQLKTWTLSPETASRLKAEIHSVQRQLIIPLKRIRWDADQGRWIKPRFKANFDPDSMPRMKELKLKKKIKKASRRYGCRVGECIFKFNSEIRREAHELQFHQGEVDSLPRGTKTKPKPVVSHSCHLCSRPLYSAKGLQAHLANVHGEGSASGKPLRQFLCPECGKVFHSIGGLRGHVATHKPDCVFRCRFCAATFQKKEARRRHQVQVHQAEELLNKPESKFRCRYCAKIFYHPNYARKHETFQHGHEGDGKSVGPKMLHCTVMPGCSFRCFGKYCLTQHEDGHKNERQFRCMVDGCGAMYNYKLQLTVHTRIHTGERPYKCDRLKKSSEGSNGTEPCNAAFTTKSNLTNHVRAVHENHVKRVHCELCGEGFPLRKYLRHHQEQHHRQEKVKKMPSKDVLPP